MSAEGPKVILECTLKYTLLGQDGRPGAQGEAGARLTERDLALLPSSGEALLFGLREITSLEAADYRLGLCLSSGERLDLSHMGSRYDGFCRELTQLRHELAIRDLLVGERPVAADFKAKHVRTHPGDRVTQGTCAVRLYETSLVILPQMGDLERIPYSFIAEVRQQGYKIEVEVEDDGNLVLSQLGPQFDLLCRTLSATINDLAVATQRYLQDLFPEVEPSAIRRAAPLLRDGRAARCADLEAISPGLWPSLEKKMSGFGMGARYGFLRSLAQPDEICVGMKRGLMGDLTGDYVWALFPICDPDPERPGNAVALEAASLAGTGRATYFFRLAGRREYPLLAGEPGELLRRVAVFCRQLNRWMLAVNFRREPIYLPEEKLNEPRYERYRNALQRIPGLSQLRERFIGRVIHTSAAQWRRDVVDLLRFNVSADDDRLKWRAETGIDAEAEPPGDEVAGETEGQATARPPESRKPTHQG